MFFLLSHYFYFFIWYAKCFSRFYEVTSCQFVILIRRDVLKLNCKRGSFSGEEFNLTEDLAWTFFHFSQHNQQFYLSAQYYASEKLFLFYVMVIGGQEVAEDFRANISIANEDHSIKIEFQGPVLAVDR